MTRRRAGSLAGVTLVMALLVGCQAGPAASPTPVAVATPTAPAASTPTIAPVVTPGPNGSGVVCPSELPTDLASVAELPDPACYGTTELTIDGWLSEIDLYMDPGEWTPSWTMALSGLFAQSPTVGDWVFDFLMSDHRPGPVISVVTPPTTGIDLLGLGRWVTLRGHFNDPAASACEVLNWDPDPQDANQDPPDLPCEQLFVVTSLDAIAVPSPVCPSESPMTHAAFFAADATCFIGREVQVTGWEDVGEGFGGVSTVMPVTLGDLRSADAQLVANPWQSDGPQNPIFPMTVRGSGVSFDRSDRQVVVTGTLGHAAAQACRIAPTSWTWTPPESWAVNRCMRLFVITGVEAQG